MHTTDMVNCNELLKPGTLVQIVGPSKTQRRDAIGRMGEIVRVICNGGMDSTIQVREGPNSIGDYPRESVSRSS